MWGAWGAAIGAAQRPRGMAKLLCEKCQTLSLGAQKIKHMLRIAQTLGKSHEVMLIAYMCLLLAEKAERKGETEQGKVSFCAFQQTRAKIFFKFQHEHVISPQCQPADGGMGEGCCSLSRLGLSVPPQHQQWTCSHLHCDCMAGLRVPGLRMGRGQPSGSLQEDLECCTQSCPLSH